LNHDPDIPASRTNSGDINFTATSAGNVGWLDYYGYYNPSWYSGTYTLSCYTSAGGGSVKAVSPAYSLATDFTSIDTGRVFPPYNNSSIVWNYGEVSKTDPFSGACHWGAGESVEIYPSSNWYMVTGVSGVSDGTAWGQISGSAPVFNPVGSSMSPVASSTNVPVHTTYSGSLY